MEFMKRADAQPSTLEHFRFAYKTIKPPAGGSDGEGPLSPTAKENPATTAVEIFEPVEAATPALSPPQAHVASLEGQRGQLQRRIYAQALKLVRSRAAAEHSGGSDAAADELVWAARALAATNELAALEDVSRQFNELADARKSATAAAAAAPSSKRPRRFLAKGASANAGNPDSDGTVPASNNTSFATEEATTPSGGGPSGDALGGNGGFFFFGKGKSNKVHPVKPFNDVEMEDISGLGSMDS
jgi:hypothetical protein